MEGWVSTEAKDGVQIMRPCARQRRSSQQSDVGCDPLGDEAMEGPHHLEAVARPGVADEEGDDVFDSLSDSFGGEATDGLLSSESDEDIDEGTSESDADIDEVFDSPDGEAIEGLLHPEFDASPGTEGEDDGGFDSLGDEAMGNDEKGEAGYFEPDRGPLRRLSAELLDTAVPPVRCVDSVINARLAHRPPSSHVFLLCRIYIRLAHGRSGWRRI